PKANEERLVRLNSRIAVDEDRYGLLRLERPEVERAGGRLVIIVSNCSGSVERLVLHGGCKARPAVLGDREGERRCSRLTFEFLNVVNYKGWRGSERIYVRCRVIAGSGVDGARRRRDACGI